MPSSNRCKLGRHRTQSPVFLSNRLRCQVRGLLCPRRSRRSLTVKVSQEMKRKAPKALAATKMAEIVKTKALMKEANN